MVPDEMVLELINAIELESLIPGLEARGWEIHSQLNTRIIAKNSTYTLLAENSRISFKGYTPKELLGNRFNKEKVAIASSVPSPSVPGISYPDSACFEGQIALVNLFNPVPPFPASGSYANSHSSRAFALASSFCLLSSLPESALYRLYTSPNSLTDGVERASNPGLVV